MLDFKSNMYGLKATLLVTEHAKCRCSSVTEAKEIFNSVSCLILKKTSGECCSHTWEVDEKGQDTEGWVHGPQKRTDTQMLNASWWPAQIASCWSACVCGLQLRLCQSLCISLQPLFWNRKNNYFDNIFYLTYLVRILSLHSIQFLRYFTFLCTFSESSVRLTRRVCLSLSCWYSLVAQQSTGGY